MLRQRSHKRATTAGKRKRGGAASEAAQEDADAETRAALADTILATLRARSGSMCPSEAPRRVRPSDWRCGWRKEACVCQQKCRLTRVRRPLMDATREVARALAADGLVQITQRGVVVDHTQPWRGPIRLRLKPDAG